MRRGRSSRQLALALTALGGAEQDFAIAIASRDEAWKAAYSRLVQYRLAVSAYFPLDHALVSSLPRLSAPYKRRAKAKTDDQPSTRIS